MNINDEIHDTEISENVLRPRSFSVVLLGVVIEYDIQEQKSKLDNWNPAVSTLSSCIIIFFNIKNWTILHSRKIDIYSPLTSPF